MLKVKIVHSLCLEMFMFSVITVVCDEKVEIHLTSLRYNVNFDFFLSNVL